MILSIRGALIHKELAAVDLNLGGFLDVVGLFTTKRYGPDPGGASGTTFFLNDRWLLPRYLAP